MLTLHIISIGALLSSMFAIYSIKKQQEELEVHWVSLYYLLAFLQSEYEDFGDRNVKLKDTTGKDIDLE